MYQMIYDERMAYKPQVKCTFRCDLVNSNAQLIPSSIDFGLLTHSVATDCALRFAFFPVGANHGLVSGHKLTNRGEL